MKGKSLNCILVFIYTRAEFCSNMVCVHAFLPLCCPARLQVSAGWDRWGNTVITKE